MQADWLSDYAVLYHYNETDHDMIAAEFVELTGLIRRAAESVIDHIFRISGVDPAPPNPWPTEGRPATVIPALFNRHSRVSGNPTVVCQDCGIIRQYRRDSRLRGNDGGDEGFICHCPAAVP